MESSAGTQLNEHPKASRRSCLVWAALAAGGSLAALSGVAQKVIQYLAGAHLTQAQHKDLLRQHQEVLDADLKLNQLRMERMDSNQIEVATLEELEPGQGKIVTDYFLQPAILLKTDSGEVTARSAVCTHLGCTVQPDLVDGKIYCPCHSSYFDANNGAVLGGPATAALAAEPLIIRDGKVYLVRPQEPVKIGPTQMPGQLS